MPTETLILSSPPRQSFPAVEVNSLLRRELAEAAEESKVLHPGWEPVLDSLRMVTVVSALERLLGIPLPPEKVIRRGGYRSVDSGVADISEKTQRIWNENQKRGG